MNEFINDSIKYTRINNNKVKYYDEEYKVWITMEFSDNNTCTPQVVDILKKVVTENI